MKYVRSMLRRFLIIFLFVLPNAAYPLEPTKGNGLEYALEVSFDIPDSKIAGVATIAVKKGQTVQLRKGKLHLVRVSLDKQTIDVSDQGETIRILSTQESILEIRYEGIFSVLPNGDNGEEMHSVIGSRGIFLMMETWYPKPDHMCQYHLTATLPQDYEAVSEAEDIKKTIRDGAAVFAFDFPHPLETIHLIATNQYRILKDRFNDTEILAYFFREDSDLVQTYIEHAKKYLSLYEGLISQFPYKRFSIVENFLPTGYSMPTYTLLGQEVVRLPFIPETSLGHEILHQWFGNLVYVDDEKGNWSEGLTTYLADQLYEEQKGRGFEYRRGALIDYQSYVNDKNEFSLSHFRTGTDRASKAIGYGKALMVFQMLKIMGGETPFYDAIRNFTTEMRFRRASWRDIRKAFERSYQRELTWFFNQWIDRKGLAELDLGDVQVKPLGAQFEVDFTVIQKKRAYVLDLPVTIYFPGGKERHLFHLDGERERFRVTSEGIPERMVIDEDYDIGRMLSAHEFPPVLARLIGEVGPIIALPPSGAEIYDGVIKAFKKNGVRAIEARHIGYRDLKTSSLIILGSDNPLVARLYGHVDTHAGFSVVIKENPWNFWKVAGIFDARSRGEVDAALPKVFHYGKYSAISFDRGTNVSKRIDETPLGITKELESLPVAVDVSATKTLSYVLEHVAGKRIIYVGETHEEYSHHLAQLEIIRNICKGGKHVAIGMEMFERPFQEALDDYVEGRTDEREFLKRTEYFKRWGFDYNLYGPILQLARSERIPVVALNIQDEIVDKVFVGGLDSLSEEEKKLLPSQMDFSDDAYKERLKGAFKEHENHKTYNFDFFYQAQVLRDEAMSESIDTFLRTHPGCQMVVLAGSGHLAYGSGIPRRTARRNGYDSAIILNDEEIRKDIADYVLFPESVPGGRSPRLMVLLTGEGGKVRITGFPKESVSERAGMKTGDIILSIDNTSIHGADDVKIDLLFRKKGDKVKVRILRETVLGGKKEMDFEVVLQ